MMNIPSVCVCPSLAPAGPFFLSIQPFPLPPSLAVVLCRPHAHNTVEQSSWRPPPPSLSALPLRLCSFPLDPRVREKDLITCGTLGICPLPPGSDVHARVYGWRISPIGPETRGPIESPLLSSLRLFIVVIRGLARFGFSGKALSDRYLPFFVPSLSRESGTS